MTAFHTDVLTLARHARTSPNPELRAAAQRVLTGDHALIAEPARTEWAAALTECRQNGPLTDNAEQWLTRIRAAITGKEA